MSAQRSSSDDGLGLLAGLAVAGFSLWVLSKIFGGSDRPSPQSAVPELTPPPPPPSPASVRSSETSSVSSSSADEEEDDDESTICDYCHRPIGGEVHYYMGRPMDFTCWDSCDDQSD